ncbi:MAG: sugar-binding protein [Acidobacteriota bacterium]|nr:sugar-binding protein [Acidobacteriota bacterium]
MRRPQPLFVTALLLFAAISAFADPPVATAVRAKTAPAIDGALDDACWQGAPLISDFRAPRDGTPAQAATLFRVAYDDRAVYFAMVCMDPNVDALVARFSGHDDTLWSDDCVELLIDTGRARQSYVHLIVNPLGAIYDAWVTNAGASIDADFETGATAAAQKNPDSWQVELSIPYVGLRMESDAGSQWGINVCREKKTPPAELSCWSPPMADGFHHPEAFGLLQGLDANFRAHMVTVGTPTLESPFIENDRLNGELVVPFSNLTGRPVGVRALVTLTTSAGMRSESDAVSVLAKGAGKLRVPVSVEPADYARVSIEITRRANGDLLNRSEHVVMLDHQPVDITFLKPAYRGTIYASMPSDEVVCALQVNVPRKQLVGSELQASLCLGETELATRNVARIPLSGSLEVAFSSAMLPAGEYTVRARAISGGQVIAEGTAPLRKLKPAPHEVIIDDSGQLRVDGRRFFPHGFMGAGPDARLAEAGFNTIHTYTAWYTHRDADLNAWLDQAQGMGLHVIMEPYPGAVSFFGFRDRAELTEQDLADIRQYVNTYKEHPALLAWYLCDEPRGAVWRANLRRVYKTVADADPYHPCVVLDNHASTLLKLQDAGDILWIDPYPGFARGGGPKEPLSMVRQALLDVKAGVRGNKPVWVAPQAFSYSEWDKAKEATERAPNLTEIRAMHYMALLNGADGIIPFAWAYAQKHPSLLNTYLSNIGPEMALLMPVMLGGEPLEHARILGVRPDDAQIMAWRYNDAVYVAVVNSTDREIPARILVPGLGDGWVKVLSADRRIQAAGGVIEDNLPAWGARVYTDARVPTGISLDQIQRRIENDEAAMKTTW